MSAVLQLREVSVSLPRTGVILRDLSLTVEQGSLCAVLGPNGAGKTTLLDACLGWRAPDSGEVLLGGVPIASMSRRERGKTVSLVPQRESVRFAFTVEEYAMLGRAPHLSPLASPGEEDYEIVRRAMGATGIERLRDRSVTTLSGGEWQLALIARSLAQQPHLLLLDEPTTHLDPAHQRLVTGLMRRLVRQGIAVLFTSHDPQTAGAVADTIHLLQGGGIRFSGSPREVLTATRLRRVYAVPFQVSWNGRLPHVRWREAPG